MPSKFQVFATESWTEYYGKSPTWGNAEYVVLTKIEASLTKVGENPRKVWETYLRNDAPFYAGKNPKLLLSSLDKFRDDAGQIMEQPPQNADPDLPDSMKRRRALQLKYLKKGLPVDEATKRAGEEFRQIIDVEF